MSRLSSRLIKLVLAIGVVCPLSGVACPTSPPITYPTINADPTADAGADQNVSLGQGITLSGISSTDADGDPLTYRWQQTAGPAVSLDNPNGATVRFVIPQDNATYTFALTVSDDRGGSDEDSVNVFVGSQQVPGAPRADAGVDHSVYEGVAVTLHGENSADPDGQTLRFSWRQLDGPQVSLANPFTSNPGFTAPAAPSQGTVRLEFELSVIDPDDLSDADTVVITVRGTDYDACPDDPNKTEPGQCGCGVSDTDSDSDGIADCNDGCPADPNKTEPGACGCGVPDTDSDGDGIADCLQVALPRFNPNGGAFQDAVDIWITCATSGATIRYTTDGTTPTCSTGSIYTQPIHLTATTTIKAIACKTGMEESAVASATFTIIPSQVATPQFDPNGGTFQDAVDVSITCATSGATIRYTTDGSTPTCSTGTVYTQPIHVAGTTTIKAIACKTGMTPSNAASATFIIKVATPTFTPNGGDFTAWVDVTMDCATQDATIRYTTDGSTPTCSSGTQYADPIHLIATTTLKAVACKAGLDDSDVASATFTYHSPSCTEVGGLITSNTTWTLAASPYCVKDNILVNSGVRLTIQAGVQVWFAAGKSLQVNGELIARGTSGQQIVFSSSTGQIPGTWGYIYLTDTSTDAVYDANGNYASGTIIQYAVIESAGSANIYNNGAVRIDACSPLIDRCTIRKNAIDGIYVWNHGAPRITNNAITDNGGQTQPASGIMVDSGGPVITIAGNTVCRNSKYGIYAYASGTTTISGNSVCENGNRGIITHGSVIGNTVTANLGGGIAGGNPVSNNIVSANHTSGSGGGIATNGISVVSGNTVTDNSAGGSGGGIYDYYSASNSVSGNTVLRNSAVGKGGGIFAYGLVSNNLIADNTASSGGAGLCAVGQSPITNNTIRNNASDSFVGKGGGIYLDSTASLSNNSLCGNTAAFGGAVYNDNPSGGANINAESNWWGTTNASVIEGLIWHYLDDSSLCFVDYDPWLTSPP